MSFTAPMDADVKGKGKRRLSVSPQMDKRCKISSSDRSPMKHVSYKDLPTQCPSDPATKSNNNDVTTLALTYHNGDIFGAPAHTLLIHACNTQGSWGAGIALAFKQHYPKAYTVYKNFCIKEHNPKSRPIPTGTALLIPPVDGGKNHWIGCLFTSTKYGKAKDKPDLIVKNTGPAVEMLLALVKEENGVEDVRMCMINSGKFGVPWEKTADALGKIEVQPGWRTSVEVWEPEHK